MTDIYQLFGEHVFWYSEFIDDNAWVPKSVLGASPDGKQFIFVADVLNVMQFDHVQQHKFIKAVLEQEKAVAYVYGTLVMSHSDKQANPEERLSIIAANSRAFVSGSWRVIRGTDGRAKEIQHVSTNEGQDPDKYPGAWFLTGANALGISDIERRNFNDVWAQLRKDVQFRFVRNAEGSAK